MSHNQSRAERTESSSAQYRRTGRSGSTQQRNFSGGGTTSKGAAAPPVTNQSRSFKKYNNAQGGGQARAGGPSLNSDASNSQAQNTVQNGAPGTTHGQKPSPVPETPAAGAPVKLPDVAASKTTRAVPKAPSSNVPVGFPETSAPATPAKAPGEAPRSFPLQFGSISPGLMTGVQVPARTSSAPPNLDEQRRDQARYEAARAAPTLPTPSIPKQQVIKKDAGDHPTGVDAHPMSKAKREGQVPAIPTAVQTQKSSVHRIPGVPLQMPFNQPQVPIQFGGPPPQLPSQAISGTSLPMHMPMPLPLPLGNLQGQQPLFVSGLQPHLIQSQGLIHQGQGLNFSSHMGPQMPPQLGNMSPQFPQQQAGKVGGPRKVKITHPDTHEELRFDGSSGPKSHLNVPPHSQPVPTTQHASNNYYSKSYSSSAHLPPSVGSIPANSTHINPSSQPPRLYNQVTVKSAGGSHGPKDTVSASSSPAVTKAECLEKENPSGDYSPYPPKDIETKSESSLQHSEPIRGLSSNLVSAQAHIKDSASGERCEKIGKPDLVLDQPSKHVNSDGSVVQAQVREELTTPDLSSQHLEAELTASSETREVAEDIEPTTSTVGGSDSHDLRDGHVLEGKTCEPSEVVTVTIKENKLSEPEKLLDAHGNLTSTECSIPGSRSLTSIMSLSSGSSKDIGQIESSSVPKVSTASNEDNALETCEGQLEGSTGGLMEDDKGGDDVVVSTSISVDKDAACPSMTDAQDHIDHLKASDARSTTPNQDSTSVFVPSPSEDNLKHEEEVSESKISDPVSESSVIKDKSLSGSNVTKSALPKKKKRKDIIKKADAAGATSDLYMAYKGPEEKKETVSVESTDITSSDDVKKMSLDVAQEDITPTEKTGQSKVEPDDWEDADFSTPKLEPPQNDGVSRNDGGEDNATKKYSRDFLLKFSEQFAELPEGFEITSDIAEALMVADSTFSRDTGPSFGNRPTSGSRDRRRSAMGDEDKWSKQPGPLVSGRDVHIGTGGHLMGFLPGQGGNYGVMMNGRPQYPVQYPMGVLPGLMQPFGPQGGMQRNNADSERWQRGTSFQKGLMPYPQTPQTPLQMMHRAEKRYQIGKVTDEEQAKQRQLKGILNKLTPQNFEKLFEQVKEVNIDNGITLSGVISQIFDKALMEPTFCEMYANFCYRLAAELPDLSVDNEKITFKRLLLNKCQEEFERGEREQQEADKAGEEGEVKQSVEELEEKRLKARRRMLGNIRLIGELYKKRMLTERIMHDCIRKLLGSPVQTPDEEDVEALCKLMSTIGEMIDHPKAKEHMDAYFDMMSKLSTNMKLSSRVRFMLLDAIDLRKNKWQQRRKVEGPKKIEEVHRDAAQERQAQASRLARTPSIGGASRRGQPMDFAPRGSGVLSSPGSQIGGLRGVPPQLRGYGAHDSRFGERHPFESRTLSVPLPQRTDDSITLGPQGGLGRGMSFRGHSPSPGMPLVDVPSPGDSRRVTSGLNGYNSIAERAAHGSREDPTPRYIPERVASLSISDQSSMREQNMNYGNRDVRNTERSFDRTLPTSPSIRHVAPTFSHNISSETALPEERLRDLSMSTIKEFYSIRDENEVVQCIKDLNAPSFYPSMVSLWVTDSFERKDMDRDSLGKLLVSLAKSRDHLLSQDQLVKGFESVLMTLEDAVNDAPKAAEFLGHLFAKVVSENVVSLSEIGKLIYEGGEERGRLVEIGLAAEVLGSVLETIKIEKGDSILTEIRASSNLPLESFRPRGSNKSLRLDKFI